MLPILPGPVGRGTNPEQSSPGPLLPPEHPTQAHALRASLARDPTNPERESSPLRDPLSLAGAPLPPGVDPLAEPEVDAQLVARVDDFVRFLAPPAPAPRTAEVEHGAQLFERIGCATCHVPRLRTGPHEVRALAHREVRAYTDLLLHDMGPELADLCLFDAAPSEFRTEPLMGLRNEQRLLHDGHATTILAAVLAHGGEGQRSRAAFEALAPTERAALLAFLASL
jgi:CxxC motif-containing protein (DUF1111 family)